MEQVKGRGGYDGRSRALTMKAIADVYTECQLDKAERFLMKLVTGLAPRSEIHTHKHKHTSKKTNTYTTNNIKHIHTYIDTHRSKPFLQSAIIVKNKNAFIKCV